MQIVLLGVDAEVGEAGGDPVLPVGALNRIVDKMPG